MLARGSARRFALSLVACGASIALLGCPVILGVDGTFEVRQDDAGAAEGGAATDAPSSPYCASLHPAPRFCDDFDDGALVAKWAMVDLPDRGGVAVDTALAQSTPRSLRSWVEANPAGSGCVFARLTTTLPAPAHATHLGYSVRFGDDAALPDRDTSAHISSQVLGTGSDLCSAIVSFSGSGLSLQEQVLGSQAPAMHEAGHTVTRTILAREWARIEVDVDYTTKRVVVTLNGQVEIDEPTKLACPYVDRPASAQIGLYCVPVLPATIAVRYDDVTFDAR